MSIHIAGSPEAAITTMPNQILPVVGGCVVAIDPDIPPTHEHVFWLPEHSLATLIVAGAPLGFDLGVTLEPAVIGPILAERVDRNGRELVIRDSSGEVHIWLLDEAAAQRPAVIIPSDRHHILRVDLASRFLRRLLGQQVGLLPPRLRLTDYQRHRYVQLLRAADLYTEGGEPRDVAAEILGSQQAELPAIEFKDSAARKRADRLIKQSLSLVNGEYLKILQGD